MVAWVRQDAIPSYICAHPCYLWETLLYKKLLCVPWVLWETLLYKKLLCVPWVLWEYHCLLGWCSRDCCTP